MGCAESSDSDVDEFGLRPQKHHPTNYSTHSSLHTNNSDGGNTAVAVMHHLVQRRPTRQQQHQQQQYQSTNNGSPHRPDRNTGPRKKTAKSTINDDTRHQTDCAPPLDDTRTRAHSSDTALDEEGRAEALSPLSSVHNNNNSRGGSSGGVASRDSHVLLPRTANDPSAESEAEAPIGFVVGGEDDDFKVAKKKKPGNASQQRRKEDPPSVVVFGAPPVKTPTTGPPGDGFPAAFPSRERPSAKHHRLVHEWRGDDHQQRTHGRPTSTTAPPSGAQQCQSGLSPAESQLLYALQAQQWQMGSDSWADVRQFNQKNNSNKKHHKTQPKSKQALLQSGNNDANNDDGPPRRHWRTLDSGERSNWQNMEDQSEGTAGPQTAQLAEPRPSEGADGGADGSSSSRPSRRQPGGDPIADSTSRGESVSNSSVVAVYAPHRPPQ